MSESAPRQLPSTTPDDHQAREEDRSAASDSEDSLRTRPPVPRFTADSPPSLHTVAPGSPPAAGTSPSLATAAPEPPSASLLTHPLGGPPATVDYRRPTDNGADSSEAPPLAAADGDTPPTRSPASPVPKRTKADRLRAVSIPGYEIVGELGRGGMGVVYKARHIGLNRLVALKMILGGKHVDAATLARFRTEAEAVARLKHPNIVQIFDIGESDGRPYFSLEFVEGGSLDKKLAGTPMPDRQAAQLVQTLARAMHSAHEAGIVHRDLKPANVLLQATEVRGPKSEVRSQVTEGQSQRTEDEGPDTAVVSRMSKSQTPRPSDSSVVTSDLFPKITDFGLAKRLEDDDGQTRSGAIMGTPSYMAPEQAAGDVHALGPLADVYALGAMLYEMLVGRPPFKGATMWDTLEQVRTREPVPPSRLQARVSRDLETICLKCLAKEPARRYGSAAALADDVGRFLNQEPILARPVSAWERSVKWARRRPTAAALIVVIVGAVLAMIGQNIYRGIKLDEARAEVRESKEREQQAKVRAEVQDFLNKGQAAFQVGDWAAAKLHLASASARVLPAPDWANLHSAIQLLQADADRHEQFERYQNEAQFYATLFTGLDPAVNAQKSRAAARQALALFGVHVDTDAPPALDGTHYTAAQQATIRETCFSLLLVLADATAYTPPQEPAAERRNRAAQALPILERAARLGSPGHAYHLRRARYLSQQGHEKEAAQERKKAQTAPPVSAQDFFFVAEDAAKGGNLVKALHDYDQALRRQPNHYWAQFNQSVTCVRLGRWAEAKLGLTACLSHQPDFPWTYMMRGFVLGQLGEFEEAEADYQHLLGAKLDAFDRYGLYANRGAMRVRRGDLANGMADLRQAIALKPDHFQAYVSLAETHKQQQQYREAIAALSKSIALEPRLPAIYRFRANMYLAVKEPDAALADFEQAIRHEPAGAPSRAVLEDHLARGKIYQDKKQHAQAVAACDDALRLQPDYAPAHRLRAESLLVLNRYAEAVTSLNVYLLQEKPAAAIYQARAQAQAKLGHLVEAVDDYTRALELEPDNAITHTQRGWSYLLVFEAPRLALRDFEQALRCDAKHADAYNGRGTCRVLLGACPAGVADAEEAVRCAGESPQLIYKAARIYALAVGKLDPDVVKGDRQAKALRAAYLEKTIQLIRRTFQLLPVVQRGAFWKELVESDAALASIRRTEGFYKLTQEYGRPAK